MREIGRLRQTSRDLGRGLGAVGARVSRVAVTKYSFTFPSPGVSDGMAEGEGEEAIDHARARRCLSLTLDRFTKGRELGRTSRLLENERGVA